MTTPHPVIRSDNTQVPRSVPQSGDCNVSDGYSVCTNAPGHTTPHWDRRTQHEWARYPDDDD